MPAANRLTVLTMVAVCMASGLPLFLAIGLADYQADLRADSYVSGLAQEVLQRSETTLDQLAEGNRQMRGLPPGSECGPAGIERLRRIDLRSTMVQAVGQLDGDVMVCSSLGNGAPIDLGPPDMVSTRGALIRTNVELLGTSDFLAVSYGSFVGIVHNDLPLSFVERAPGLAVGTFNWSQRRLLIGDGALDPRWVGPRVAGNAVFRSGDTIVAVARSQRYDLGTVAAVPSGSLSGFAREAAMVLVPLGVMGCVLMSLLLVRAARTRVSMPAMIRQALRGEEFHLLYQPVVDLATGDTIGAEALVRWRRPDGETIPPENFIAVAEQAGVIRLITGRVLDLLAEDVQSVLAVQPRFHFAVNFSAADMHSEAVIAEVHSFVERSTIGYANLVVEATERSFVDVDRARGTIRQLRAAGIQVAIDDFGTGYSSLGYLAQLEVDLLKIDRLFVHALGTGSATSQVAERIIDMAKDLRLKIVAEGIETAEQAQQLRALNVEFAQGYYFAPPMPVSDLLHRLRTERRRHRHAAPGRQRAPHTA